MCNTTGTNSDWNHAKSMLLFRAGRICILLNDIVHPSNEITVSRISETLYSFALQTKDFCAYFNKRKCSVSENFCIKSLQLEFWGGPWWSAIWIIIIGVVPCPSFFYVKSMSYITSCVEVCKYVNLYAAGCRNATESKKRNAAPCWLLPHIVNSSLIQFQSIILSHPCFSQKRLLLQCVCQNICNCSCWSFLPIHFS